MTLENKYNRGTHGDSSHMLSTVVLSNENQTCRGWEATTSTGGGGCHYQSHKEKSVKGGHRPQRLPLILFFVGYNAGGENGCPSVSLLPPVLHCPFRRKKVKGGLRPFFICCTR